MNRVGRTLHSRWQVLLIRDLDDPFEYTREGAKSGSVEASLDPLIRLQGRLPAPDA